MGENENTAMKNIMKRYKEIRNNSEYLEEALVIECQMEADIFKWYKGVCKYCKDNRIGKVVDIGCGYGHQSEFFVQEDIEYTGVEELKKNFFNEDRCEYINRRYPFDVDFKGALAVSHLCLGYKCYSEDEATYDKQFKALAEQFGQAVVYAPESSIEIARKYFLECERILDDSYLLKAAG